MQKPAPVFSFEFFPPRSEEIARQLRTVSTKLACLAPSFFSVNFGARGSTRDQTLETALAIRNVTGIDAAPHLACIGFTREQLKEILESYRASDIRRIVALRGDIPSGTYGIGDFRYAAEL